MQSRITFKQFPNSDMRIYHVSAVISLLQKEKFKSPINKKSERRLEKTGRYGEIIVRWIMETEGVCKMTITPQYVEITKSPAYDWSEIHQETIKALTWVIKRRGAIASQIEIINENEREAIENRNPPGTAIVKKLDDK